MTTGGAKLKNRQSRPSDCGFYIDCNFLPSDDIAYAIIGLDYELIF